MKPFISTTFHGVADYAFSFLLGASPWIFGFYGVHGAAFFIPIYFGWITLIMAIFTDYKMSLIRQFPITMHLTLDMVAGFVIMVSPFLYGFAFGPHGVWAPHFFFGLYLFLQALFTQHSPFTTPTPRSLSEGSLRSTDESESRLTV